ncbi:N/A [soil metagenome]
MGFRSCRYAASAALALITALGLAQAASAAVAPPTPADLSQLSIEELGDIQVTSVSKRGEAIGEAPSAIYVITHDEIVRSGAGTIPEMLRLAPNLQVAQTSASRYVITARGFGGVQAAQNFSNKLLVLIDGRSVYSPLFSGVYWDMQDVTPEDIDRIEVISGPGATLWGANAVNGVINIITKKAGETQGGFIEASGGERRSGLGLRYGGKAGEAMTWRVYARAFRDDDTQTAAGASANDHWSKPQAGFRLDWARSDRDEFALQGDVYSGYEAQARAPAESVEGGNLMGRWSRSWMGGSSLQVQAYYDHVQRGQEVDGSGFRVETYDLDVQNSIPLGPRNDLVWGGGYRVNDYHIDGSPQLMWSPPSRSLGLGNLFVQDSIALTSKARLMLGVKLEDDPYVRATLLPTARLSWTPMRSATLWGAVSRAIRSATPFDREVVEVLNGSPFLIGGPNFQSEKLTAYELGAKLQATSRASLSVTAFYNVYDDLRSIEIQPGGFLPLRWGNGMAGETYGVEAWGDFQAADWWRLSASFNSLHETFAFKPGASGLLGVSQAANDPKYRAGLKSSMNLGRAVTLDADLRYLSALPNPRLSAYTELNGRLGWSVTDKVELALTGRNLLDDRHIEYISGNAIPRSLFADLRVRF